MKVDWVTLKNFIANCSKIKTQQDWFKMKEMAVNTMNKRTLHFAIEHLYLYAPETVE